MDDKVVPLNEKRNENKITDLEGRISNLETLIDGLIAVGFKKKKGSSVFVDYMKDMWMKSSRTFGAEFNHPEPGEGELFPEKVKNK